ncbi:GAP family protein [Actinomadura sp. NAK00032]|nr:GAP family protein [Actinomadura sp. NAK00032]
MRWIKGIDTFTPAKAASFGLLFSAVNPEDLMRCAAVGIAIARGVLSAGGQAVSVAVFVVIAVCSVAVFDALGPGLAGDAVWARAAGGVGLGRAARCPARVGGTGWGVDITMASCSLKARASVAGRQPGGRPTGVEGLRLTGWSVQNGQGACGYAVRLSGVGSWTG